MAGNSNVHSSSVCVFKFVFFRLKQKKQNKQTQIVIGENFRLFQVQCHERDTNAINE